MGENELTRESVSASNNEGDAVHLMAQMKYKLYTGACRRKIKKNSQKRQIGKKRYKVSGKYSANKKN